MPLARVPEASHHYIKRVLDYAKQGYASIEFPTYDTDWDSEAYLTVSGQNSNNSVRVTDAFLKAVEEDSDWELIRRTDGSVAHTIKARDLWNQIGHAAWACADPGILHRRAPGAADAVRLFCGAMSGERVGQLCTASHAYRRGVDEG